MMKRLIRGSLPWVDWIFAMPVFLSAHILKLVRHAGVQHMPASKRALLSAGVFPIRNHYYEPLFNAGHLAEKLSIPRQLPGINWNVKNQLAFVNKIAAYADEFSALLAAWPGEPKFTLDNPSFGSGDAEFWYGTIRSLKPRRIIEIGSGHSTLIAVQALKLNAKEQRSHSGTITCIEPYEMDWLEKTEVEVVRKRVEDVPLEFFTPLGEDDILFIDSSHVIRPQGDVLFEFLQILPLLRRGVVVHVHDIFTPRDYLAEWLIDEVRFFNEQYLLEAFLTENDHWELLAGLNHLHHKHYGELSIACPFLTPDREPGSFYMRRCS